MRDRFLYISGGSRDGEKSNLYINKSKSHKHCFYIGAKSWNILPQPLRQAESTKQFDNALKNKILYSIKVDNNNKVDKTYDLV